MRQHGRSERQDTKIYVKTKQKLIGRAFPVDHLWIALSMLAKHAATVLNKSYMFEVMVEKHFAAAHHLLNYRGKCENPHGHNYVVQVFAKKDTLDKANVAFDFTILKSELGQVVDDLDHRDLNEFPDFNGESPSAEYIARYVYQRIKKNVPEITKACVYETPTQCACYFE